VTVISGRATETSEAKAGQAPKRTGHPKRQSFGTVSNHIPQPLEGYPKVI